MVSDTKRTDLHKAHLFCDKFRFKDNLRAINDHPEFDRSFKNMYPSKSKNMYP